MIVRPITYHLVKLVSFDPGLTNTGVAVYELDFLHRRILSINAFTITNDKLSDRIGWDIETTPDRFFKLQKLEGAVRRVIENEAPLITACEAPFYNRFRPTAYAALLQVTTHIERAVRETNPNTSFSLLEPLFVKKIIGASSMKGKISVKEAVLNTPDIMEVLVQDLDDLDDHSIDAVAIGYSYIKTKGLLNENDY